MTKTAEDFRKLFSGCSDAYGTGQGRWVKKPLLPHHYKNHLEGVGSGIGVAPLLDDGTIRFAAIDLDEPDFEAALEMQGYLPGPSFIERSRSGNAHVWVFFSNPIDAWIPRGILKYAVLAAGKAAVEVFPKQDKLLKGMIGNYINLPYHGDTRPVLYGKYFSPTVHKKDYLEPMPVRQFVSVAAGNLNDPSHWKSRARWLGIAPPEEREATADYGTQKELHICAEYIIANRDENPVTAGHRAVVYFSLAKMLCNFEGFDHDEALSLMELVNDSSPDPITVSELRRILCNAERGQFTSTGCDDPIMQPYIHPDCPIGHNK